MLKKKLTATLVALLLITALSGCGKEEEEAYSSPSFSNGSKQEATESDAEEEDASLTDALMIASFTDATASASLTDALTASLTDAPIMGLHEKNVYYNTLAGFKIEVDGNEWKFYNAAEVATAMDASVDYVNNLWYGYTSPYDEGTTYASIASHKESGSTIIVSYVNPENYNMPDYTAKEYLQMAAGKYEDLHVRTVTFLGDKYEVLDVPDEQSNVGRRTQFAIKKEGLIVVITFTTNNDYKLEEAVGLISPLYY
ncbi:hypothetical protein SAMN02910369_01797 [Lachnospiraceae bacterium NE2001]|nr:hypothetical protein SAMN02910369_01797 [Lachnospiraceae bacterium NE2001]